MQDRYDWGAGSFTDVARAVVPSHHHPLFLPVSHLSPPSPPATLLPSPPCAGCVPCPGPAGGQDRDAGTGGGGGGARGEGPLFWGEGQGWDAPAMHMLVASLGNGVVSTVGWIRSDGYA